MKMDENTEHKTTKRSYAAKIGKIYTKEKIYQLIELRFFSKLPIPYRYATYTYTVQTEQFNTGSSISFSRFHLHAYELNINIIVCKVICTILFLFAAD